MIGRAIIKGSPGPVMDWPGISSNGLPEADTCVLSASDGKLHVNQTAFRADKG